MLCDSCVCSNRHALERSASACSLFGRDLSVGHHVLLLQRVCAHPCPIARRIANDRDLDRRCAGGLLAPICVGVGGPIFGSSISLLAFSLTAILVISGYSLFGLASLRAGVLPRIATVALPLRPWRSNGLRLPSSSGTIRIMIAVMVQARLGDVDSDGIMMVRQSPPLVKNPNKSVVSAIGAEKPGGHPHDTHRPGSTRARSRN